MTQANLVIGNCCLPMSDNCLLAGGNSQKEEEKPVRLWYAKHVYYAAILSGLNAHPAKENDRFE